LLATAGRGRVAAHAYLAAVPGTSDAETRLKLRRRAAEHFLTTGHVAEGLDTLRSVLAEVDLRLASTPERAVASLLLHRARVRLRGLGFQRRDASQIDARELARVDVGLSVGWGLAMVDFIRSADFHARTVLRALDAGEPARLSFVLCTEAAIRARGANSAGALAYARAMLQVGSELATQLGDPGLIATAQTNEACIDFVSGHWRRSLELFDEAIKTFRERCAGFWWQRDLAVTVSVLALTFAGRLRELSARISQWSGEAIARGNLYLETSLRLNAMVRIAADDAVGARREAADAIGRWATGCFDFQHFQERVAQCYVGLYLGDGVAAYRCMAEAWPSLKAARMLHAPIVSVLGHAARARAAILAARQAGDRKILLRQAAADAKKIRRQRMLWSEPMARLIEAGCAATLERLDVARDDLTVAVQGFDDADMALEAAAARRRLGELVGGDEGRALLAQSDEYMHQQGIRCPERMMAVVAPGFTEPRAY